MFDLSFLIKQGGASLALDDEQQPVIQPCVPADRRKEDAEDLNLQSSQLVMSLNPKQYRELVEAFGCKGQGIEHREDASYAAGYVGVEVANKSVASTTTSSSRPSKGTKGKGKRAAE